MKKILIFGGSGFIGRYLVKELLEDNFYVGVVCTNYTKATKVLPQSANLRIYTSDIFNQDEIYSLVKNFDIIVNLIGKLYEGKKGMFAKFHTTFAQILSNAAKENNKYLIHISALGIEESAKTSIYAKTKLDGESAIINCNNYTIIRPSIVFGNGDGFFGLFAKMAKISPFLPLIGGGKTMFAPIFAEDLSNAILFIANNPLSNKNKILQAYGNDTVSFKDLLKFTLYITKKKRFLINIPFYLAKAQARLLNLLHIHLLTEDQVELLKYNNMGSDKYDNIDIITKPLQSYKHVVPKYLS